MGATNNERANGIKTAGNWLVLESHKGGDFTLHDGAKPIPDGFDRIAGFALKPMALSFIELAEIERGRSATDDQYRQAARDLYIDSSEDIEVDDHAIVSRSGEGAFVAAWLWVNKESVAHDVDTWGAIDCLDYIRENDIEYNEPEETAEVDLDEVRNLVKQHMGEINE